MEYLKLLPISNVTIWITVFVITIYFLDFLSSKGITRILENSRNSLTRKLLVDGIWYIIVTLFCVISSSPDINNYIMFVIFSGIIITYVLCETYSQAKHSRLQIAINKLYIKIFGTGKMNYYKLSLIFIHTMLVLFFYLLFIKMFGFGIRQTYNFEYGNNLDILIILYNKNKYIFYLFFIVTIIMFQLLNKVYLSPCWRMLKAIFSPDSKVNIKLASGDLLSDLFIIQSSDSKYLFLSNNSNLKKSTKTYSIHKDKIDYIEVLHDPK